MKQPDQMNVPGSGLEVSRNDEEDVLELVLDDLAYVAGGFSSGADGKPYLKVIIE